jgi:lysozyme
VDTAKLLRQLEDHEGFNSSVYQDSLGYWTIGIGRLVDSRKGGGISKGEAQFLLQNDVVKVRSQLDEYLPWWSRMDEVRQRVLVDLCFNLGITGLLGFHKTLRLIQEHKFELAAEAMLASRWATQVKRRALRLSQMMATGEDV